MGEKPSPPSEGAISKEIMYCDYLENCRRSKNLNFSKSIPRGSYCITRGPILISPIAPNVNPQRPKKVHC